MNRYREENPVGLPQDYIEKHNIIVQERTRTIDKRQLDRSLVKKRREFSF